MNARRVLIAFALVLAVAACAKPERWQKQGANQDQWERDNIQCRSVARRETEKDLRQRRMGADSPFVGGGSYEQNMAQHQGLKDQRRRFEDCLAGRGYRRVEGPKAGN